MPGGQDSLTRSRPLSHPAEPPVWNVLADISTQYGSLEDHGTCETTIVPVETQPQIHKSPPEGMVPTKDPVPVVESMDEFLFEFSKDQGLRRKHTRKDWSFGNNDQGKNLRSKICLSFPVRPSPTSRKRGRHLSDVEGDGSSSHRKKRRLRLEPLTSKLSAPFSDPASHFVDRGSSKIAVWAKQKGLGTSLLRKAAILNSIRHKSRSQDFFENAPKIKVESPGGDTTETGNARSSNHISKKHVDTQEAGEARLAFEFPRYPISPSANEPAERPSLHSTSRSYASMPPTPLGLSNYDAFDLSDGDEELIDLVFDREDSLDEMNEDTAQVIPGGQWRKMTDKINRNTAQDILGGEWSILLESKAVKSTGGSDSGYCGSVATFHRELESPRLQIQESYVDLEASARHAAQENKYSNDYTAENPKIAVETIQVDDNQHLHFAILQELKAIVLRRVQDTRSLTVSTYGNDPGSTGRREQTTSNTSALSSTPKQQSSSNSNKRARSSSESSEIEDQESEDDQRRKKRPRRSQIIHSQMRRVKCPYHQKSPETYVRAACRGEGFTDMAKLK
ncbi:hypothetical protein BDV96DRAFT_406861 [Lophiotrema nucula]|uniref:Uncharacterized protein n=1 Tax=Lophiotrema nucula TaxID=690887 RepID=A0A6A5ZFU6_9PLEO|nr:hypothetical protein BDV96DRAFT_406861 [Lophiotrema nucula]